jgi:pilus biogenesis lipoprotein CpaD
MMGEVGMIYLKAMGFVACVAGMALTACQPYQPSLYNAANHDPRVAHPLNVEPGRADAVIRFVADSAVLELAQATKLASFVDNFLSHGHGSLNVTIVEDGSPRQTLVARARVIGRLAGQRGLPAGALVVGYGAAGQAGDAALPTALLRYDRFVVKLPTCPDWSGAANRRALNQNHSNFGCATQSMFGAMVSDPADLVRQRRAGKSDSERLHRVIRRFRDGTPTGGGGGSTGAAPSTGGG